MKIKVAFQINNSTDHAILQFTCDIVQTFDYGKFTRDVFIDLWEKFYTADHLKILKKLNIIGPIKKH